MLTLQRRSIALVLLALVVGVIGGCANGPPPTDVQLGEMALERGDWRTARSHFAIALRVDARNARAWLGQARSEAAGRDPESALRSLRNLVKVDLVLFKGEGQLAYADALEGAASVRLRKNQSKEALDAARALVRLEPERRGLNRLLGDALLSEASRLRLRGDPKGAYLLFEEASRVAPERLEGWVGAAEIMIASKRGKGAVRYLEAARRYHPTSREIRMLSIQAISER